MAEAGRSGAVRAFADAHGLQFDDRPSLPREGDLLARSDQEAGPAASGELPGALDGTLSHFAYTTTDSEQRTERHLFTLVVAELPESIGFAPYLGFSGRTSDLTPQMVGGPTRRVDLGEDSPLDGTGLWAFEGIDDAWLRELLSPALLDWLARSPDDFGFELANGILCAARNGHLTDAAALTALCEDSAHLAEVIRAEALEEAHTGGAARSAAKRPPTADDVMVANAIARFGADREVADTVEATPEFRRLILRNPGTWLYKLFVSLAILLGINIPGVALPIVLGTSGLWGLLLAIEGTLLAIIYFFVMRSHLRGQSAKYAVEAFFRAYARDRRLELEDPLRFAALHAEAKLPFKPDRVLTGPLPGGVEGSLAISGQGLKRGDRIALVAGPAGPVETLALEVSPPGLSAADLDAHAGRLAEALRARSG